MNICLSVSDLSQLAESGPSFLPPSRVLMHFTVMRRTRMESAFLVVSCTSKDTVVRNCGKFYSYL